MQTIKLTIGLLVFATFIATSPGEARYDGAWCAYRSIGNGTYSSRCDLRTFEACRAWLHAQPGSWCTQNPHYQAAETPTRRKAR